MKGVKDVYGSEGNGRPFPVEQSTRFVRKDRAREELKHPHVTNAMLSQPGVLGGVSVALSTAGFGNVITLRQKQPKPTIEANYPLLVIRPTNESYCA